MGHLMEDPAFWVAIAFVAFVGVMIKFAYGKIVGALDERAAGIKSELDEAVKLREEAQSLLAGYQRKQRDAVSEAEDIIAQAKADAERLATDAEAALEAEVKRRTDMALDKIAQAEAQVVQDVRNTSIEVAIKAAEKLISENLDDAKARSLIDESISDIEGKLH